MDASSTEKLSLMVGGEGLSRLSRAAITVVGLGGVGSACAVALARAGVGALTLVDCDCVQASNINRQAVAFRSTLGQRKTEVMRAIVADINPDCAVQVRDEFILPETVPSLYTPTPDFIVDAVDTVAVKLALAVASRERGIPHCSSMGAGNKFDPCQLRFADIYDTRVCPLCKVMRKEARARGIEHLRVLYSPETPVSVQVKGTPSRSERANIGTMSYMPPIMGQMLAADAICTLLGVEPL